MLTIECCSSSRRTATTAHAMRCKSYSRGNVGVVGSLCECERVYLHVCVCVYVCKDLTIIFISLLFFSFLPRRKPDSALSLLTRLACTHSLYAVVRLLSVIFVLKGSYFVSLFCRACLVNMSNLFISALPQRCRTTHNACARVV